MLKNRRWVIDLLVLVALSLIPFLWLKSGQAILGHDAGFPLSPWPHFLDRVFLWTHRFGLGNDQTTEVGAFFIHGFEGLVSYLGFSLTRVQQITFSFYFFGFGISMYLLAKELFPAKKNLPLLAATIYMLNHFLLQAWFIVERTKFTLYIALPLAVLLLYRVATKKTPPLTAAILASFVIFFLNGGGFLPLFGAFFITIPLLFVLFPLLGEDKGEVLRRVFFFCVFWGIGAFLLNAYWIFPFIRFVFTSFGSELATAGGTSGVLAWIQTISENASYYNLLRLQGIQEWYVNPLHPYAKTFLTNSIFVIFSHLLPLLAFSGLLFAQKAERKILLILSTLFFLSIIFMAGSHPPFGFFYVWMIEHVPGFVAFRTPFYKFAPALWLAAALMIAYGTETLISKLRIKENYKYLIYGVCILIWCVYNFPYFTGNFTDYEVGHKTTKVTVPQYVFDYAHWANSNDFPYHRLLLLPGQNPDTHFEAYTWGYWSLASIQGLLNNRSYVSNSLYKATTEEIFIKNLYALADKGDMSWVDHAQYLFIDAVLLRKDFDYKLKGSQVIDPSILEKQLDADPRFKKVREFGPWIVYELNSNHQSFAFKDYYYRVNAQNKESFFEPTNLPDVKLDNKTVFVEEEIPSMKEREKGILYIPKCIHCLLDGRNLYLIDRNQLITASSFFYSLKINNEYKKVLQEKDVSTKLHLIGELSTRRLYEIQTQFIRLSPISERLIGWQQFNKALDLQSTVIDEYLNKYPSLTPTQNDYLSVVYTNSLQQYDEIRYEMEKVDNKEEADLFLAAQDKLKAIVNKLETQVWYTADNISKKYLVESQENANFNVWVKTSTMNATLPLTSHEVSEGKSSLQINGKDYPINITPPTTPSLWVKVGNVSLVQGLNKVQFNDIHRKRVLAENGKASLILNYANNCENLPVGQLERASYIFTLEGESQRDLRDLYVFIDTPSVERPLLPYWGNRLIINAQRTNYFDFTQQITQPGEYVMRICNLGSTADEVKVQFNNMYVERVSDPLLVFAKPNENPVSPPSDLHVISKKNYPTDYELTFTGSGKSLLMFDQRFDSGWEYNVGQLFSQHLRIHGYANGWLVEKSSPEPVKVRLQYISQKYYKYGWIVALTTATLFLTYLLWNFIKKKDNYA